MSDEGRVPGSLVVHASFVVHADGRIHEVADNLSAAMGAVFDGRHFEVDDLRGDLSADGEGTLVEGTFVLLAAGPKAGLAPCRPLAQARADRIARACGSEDAFVLSLIGDPSAPGSEVVAPTSLEARIHSDWVEFVVRGPWAGTNQRGASGVLVEARGVTLKTPTLEVLVTWDELMRCVVADHEGGFALDLLGAHDTCLAAVPCAGSSDDAWLAAYLDAQAHRRRESAQERAERERESARLSALLGTIRDPDNPQRSS